MSGGATRLRRLEDPDDPGLAELSGLLHAAFADPDTVLELDRMQAFLARAGAATDRHFCVVVAEEAGVLVGGTVFSYVPATNCGFSEYLVARKERHGQGIGRLLFEARRALLNQRANDSGQPSCSGLFIEADNPQRTPLDLQIRERVTAMDAVTRLRLFAHLGFLRVDLEYVQPALGPGKSPVRYLDLLFAPWDEHIRQQARVPGVWVTETLCPIWKSWSNASSECEALRQRLGTSTLTLRSLVS
ncbi:MAG: GNAT family N-acetyltransferase [Chloroflexota bacterium]|nr:GNAT family N-acetyltransferase [Chloroflexota bacterium]